MWNCVIASCEAGTKKNKKIPPSPQIAHIENTYKYTQGVRQGRQTNSWRRSSRWTTALGVGWIMDSEHGESVSWCGPGSHGTPCSISCEFKKQTNDDQKKKRRAKNLSWKSSVWRLMFFQSAGQIFAPRRSGAINRGHLSYSITEGLPQDRPLFLCIFAAAKWTWQMAVSPKPLTSNTIMQKTIQ